MTMIIRQVALGALALAQRRDANRPQLDRSRPVPEKSEIIEASLTASSARFVSPHDLTTLLGLSIKQRRTSTHRTWTAERS